MSIRASHHQSRVELRVCRWSNVHGHRVGHLRHHTHNRTPDKYPDKYPGCSSESWSTTSCRSRSFTMDLYKAAFLLGAVVYTVSSTTISEVVCVVGEGQTYRGRIAWMWSGKSCQSWASQTPHQHSRTTSNYPDKGLDSNYCRNPDNSELPWCYTTDPGTRWEYCSVPRCLNTPGPEECILYNGENYRGKIHTTQNTFTCQRWDSQTPHKHDYSPSAHPEKQLEENYCRNLGGEPRPWCFTTNPSKRWDYCSVPHC